MFQKLIFVLYVNRLPTFSSPFPFFISMEKKEGWKRKHTVFPCYSLVKDYDHVWRKFPVINFCRIFICLQGGFSKPMVNKNPFVLNCDSENVKHLQMHRFSKVSILRFPPPTLISASRNFSHFSAQRLSSVIQK